MLYYSIAHYFDRHGPRSDVKYSNIKKHIDAFLDVKEDNKEFILVSFVDTPRGHVHYGNVKRHLEEFYEDDDIEATILAEHVVQHKSIKKLTS